MTHEQHIAEIREALELIPRCSAQRVREAIACLDTLAAECLRLREEKPRLFRVSVLQENASTPHEYCVSASTENDAIQLAFALDGGWCPGERDAEEMLELAKSYASIIPQAQALDAAKEVR